MSHIEQKFEARKKHYIFEVALIERRSSDYPEPLVWKHGWGRVAWAGAGTSWRRWGGSSIHFYDADCCLRKGDIE